MSDTQKTRIEAVLAYFNSLENRSIQISEQLCFDPQRAWDRHCTLVNRLSFEVQRVGWQMSGGHLYLWGAEMQYGFFSGHLVAFEQQENGAEIIEHLSETLWRKTRINNRMGLLPAPTRDE